MVTKRPLELRLKRLNTEGKFARFPNEASTLGGHTSDKKYKIEEICDMIEKFTNEKIDKLFSKFICTLSDNVKKTKEVIIEEPIVLEIYSQDLPDLTLIDLPGLVKLNKDDSYNME